MITLVNTKVSLLENSKKSLLTKLISYFYRFYKGKNNDNNMKQETQITIKISKEDKDLIRKAAQIVGLGHSTFCRTLALKEALKILKDQEEFDEDG